MKSIWTDTCKMPAFDALKGDIKTDVLIIGGGIAGILCAFFLKQAGVDYVLAEGDKIGAGITKNTTAKITSQHGLIYDTLIRGAGCEKARQYLEANQLAVSKFEELAKEIPCDFEKKSAFTYSLHDRARIEKEVDAVNRLGLKADFTRTLPLPFPVAGAIRFENQAQFHPLKFILGIAEGLHIYENTFVKAVDGHTALTENGRIRAKAIVVATHFPFINTHGNYFLKMYQHRSYVLALENAPDLDGMYLEETEDGLSFRNYENLLLVGGGDHQTGKRGGRWQVLRAFVKKAYPEAIEKYAWATQDCMTLDYVPYIGHYAKSTPHLYVATGFNKWGMTSSMAAAMILTDMLTGKISPFADVFFPSRSILKPQLFVNGFTAVTNLLSFSAKRCPHLGCALKWNEAENTWDCPCHGSRFTKSGKLIDNPATGDANIE